MTATPLLTVKDVCAQLQASRTTIHVLRRAGELRPLKIGRNVRFRQEDIDTYLKECLERSENQRW